MGTRRVQIHFVAGLLILHLLAPASGAFESGDLAGDWWLHGLISGDSSASSENPGWFWMSLQFDADGNALPTSTVHDSLGNTDYTPTLEQYAIDRFGGVTSERIGSLGGAMSIGENLIVATATMAPGAYEDVRGYNLQVYTRAASGFATADLAGTWDLHGVISGDAPQFTSWMYGTVTLGANGAFSFSIYDVEGPDAETGSGTANLTSDGLFTIQDDPSAHGVMSNDKSLVVFTMDDGGGGYSLSVMQKRSAETFAAADLTGVWHVHGVSAGDAPQWTGWFRGDMEVRSSGALAMSLARSDASIERITDTVYITNDGVVTFADVPSAHGVMSDDKTLIVLTMTDGGGGYDLVILNRSVAAVPMSSYTSPSEDEYGIRTFEWTYGKSGTWTSQIKGPVTVNYGDGSSLTGVEFTNAIDVGGVLWNDAATIDDGIVKVLAMGELYHSSDEYLTSHPDVWSFGAVTDGMLIDMRPYYLVATDPPQAFLQDAHVTLLDIQDVNVLRGHYSNALLWWSIDTDYDYVEMDFFGKDGDLGITLPTALDTGGYAVMHLAIRGPGTGRIALASIDRQTGQLQYLGELKEVSPYILHDWNEDGLVSIVGDVPPFVNCVYFNNCPTGMNTVAVGDCNGDGLLSIVGDVPCFVNCVYFENCP